MERVHGTDRRTNFRGSRGTWSLLTFEAGFDTLHGLSEGVFSTLGKAGLRPCKGDRLPTDLEELWAWRLVTETMCVGDIAKTEKEEPRSEM